MKKEIKVTSRGMVFTSRGKCRTPLLYPIVEDTSVILKMITAQRATVVEVLPDGREIELTPQNFDQDNTNATEAKSAMSKPEPVSASAIKPKKKVEKKQEEPKVEEPKVEEPAKEETPAEEPQQEQPLNTKTMSRKERKRQEYLQKQKEQEAKAAEEKAEETSSDTTIPEDAIEQ